MKFRNRVLCGVSLAAAMAWCGAASAGEAEPRQFNIPAGDMASALAMYGLQSGKQLSFRATDVRYMRAPAISGRLLPSQALAALLRDSGLRVSTSPSGGLLLHHEPAPRAVLTRVALQSEARSAAPEAVAQSESLIGEVIVTATRSAEVLSRVPISVSVFSQEKMDQQGIKQLNDIVRFTPGLALNTGNTGSNDVSIRGVRSTAGASTTGIYVDDVPIQVRQVGYSAGTLFPAIFDLERIEVLRGPQGTLFGSGSQGGTVRFIQPGPSVERYSAYGRVEGSLTPKAEGSYEGGVAVGGPIVQDKLGFRVSAYYRRDGGWIDKVPGTFNVVDPIGASYGDSIIFTPTGEGEKNYNTDKVAAFRGALKFAPTENFTITPSIFFQQRKTGGTGSFWLSGTATGFGRFVIPDFSPGPVTPTSGLTQLSLPDSEAGDNNMLIASNGIEWVLEGVTFYATSSYLRQYKDQYMDFTTGYERSYMGQPVAAPGAKGVSLYHDLQNSYVQEVRLQSDPERRLKWTVGGFFQTSEQRSTQLIEVNTWYLADSFFGIPNLDHGSPFGPGFNNAENIWGAPMLGESGVYLADASTRERQVAGFGQIDFKLTNQITLTGGVRLSRNWLKYSLFSDGPENNLNAPFGAECPTGPVCPFNNGGPFAPDMPIGTVSTAENAVTPKVGINFQMDPDNLFYVSIAKGYRPGGAQIPLPTACDADLIAWGYVDADGSAVTPLTYDSDNVWSYEVGAKNSRLFGGLASFSGSAYMIKWKGIQTELSVPTCGYSFVDNLSSASVKGFDASLDLRPIDGLLLSATVGYNDLEIEESFLSPTGGVIISGGAPIAGAAIPWRVVLSGQYDRQLTADVDGYARADLTYQSKTRRTGTQVPGVINHDPLVTPTGETTLVNARVGVTRGPADVSLFVNNLFDAHPLIGRSHGRRNPIWTASTFRPRTIGVTAAFRY